MPGRVSAPDVDPDTVARQLIEEYDANADQMLSRVDELDACPALVENLGKYDSDSNGVLTLEEIRTRLEEIYGDRLAYYPLYARVTLDGMPLRNARVTFAPEEAFGEAIHPADGVTDGDGYAILAVADSNMPADLQGIIKCVQTGLYRVRVTHDSQPLPPEVTDGDYFGFEIAADDGDSAIKLKIATR